jgi:hypothetical protein
MTKTSRSDRSLPLFPFFVSFFDFLLPFAEDDDDLEDLGETKLDKVELLALRLCCPWKYIFNLDAEGNFGDDECPS